MHTLIRALLLFVSVSILFNSGCKPEAEKSSQTVPADAAKVAAKEETASSSEPASSEPASSEPEGSANVNNSEQSLETKNVSLEPQVTESAKDQSSTTPASGTQTPEMETHKPTPWTSQRLVLMGNGGPRFFRLDVCVGGQDLERGFQSAIAKIAGELSINFDEPIDWNALLDKPLIASGWLGNLVPNSEQREQLRGLYDANKDDKVDEDELRAFLTRGLSRTAFLRLFSRRYTAPQLPTNSIWGPVDLDDSGDLSLEELGSTTKTMLRFDFDGDRILSTAEMRSVDSQLNMTTRDDANRIELSVVNAWDLENSSAMAKSILDNYSFGAPMSSRLLFAWPAARIKQFDTNGDTELEDAELRVVSDRDLNGEFQFLFPDQTTPNTEKLSVNFRSIDPETQKRWLSHPEGGRLTLDGCIVTIVLNDEQSITIHEAFKLQLGRIARDTQLQTFAMQALELKDGAFDTLKTAAEQEQVEAGEIAWRWLVTPRHWHVQIGWSASDSPWFELMDLNGDQKLVVTELDQFAGQAKSWDRNADGIVAADEMPVSVLLEVKRTEVRGIRSRLGGTAIEKRGANDASAPTWFTGMDYNSDGELSQSEFLGDQSDFEKLDQDRDGIIEAREVSSPQ